MVGHPRPRVGTAACVAACALLCAPATAPSGGNVQEDGLRLAIELNTNGYPDLVAVEIRAANPRGPGGPTGPLGTPFWTPGTLSRPSITHWKPFWDPLILASGTFG